MIFEAVRNPVFIVQYGRVAYANSEGLRKLGCTHEEATRKTVSYLVKKCLEKSSEDAAKGLIRVLKKQIPSIEVIPIVDEGGKSVSIELQTEKIEYNQQPALILVIKYLGDPDQQELYPEEALLSSNLTNFMLTIRDPLQSILNASYCIYEALSSQQSFNLNRDEAKKMLTIVEDAIVRANQVIVDLTEYKEDKPLILELIRVESLIEEARRCVSVNSNTVTKETSEPLQLPLVKLDRQDIVRAFSRILRSIAKSMPRGGILCISAAAVDDYVEVSFSGSEFHLPEEQFSSLFEPFSFMKDKGMGLDLPIVKHFVERNGGSIALRNPAGKGTEFVVKLPIYERR